MIIYKIGKTLYHPRCWNFPAGEVGVAVLNRNNQDNFDSIEITASLQSSEEIIRLLMLTDALRRFFVGKRIDLVLGYVPYGRQDRVCNEGEALAISVFANIINSQNYNKVTIFDPHSDVTSAVFNNCVVVKQDQIFHKVFGYSTHNVKTIVAPDAGAAKKANVIGKATNNPVVYASKARDMMTGNITSMTFFGNVAGENVLVVDDICDGGATFLELGKQLKLAGANKIELFVTHGIFSKGTKELTELYDAVYTTNTYHQDREGLVDGVSYHKII